jgi:hypothetical protein
VAAGGTQIDSGGLGAADSGLLVAAAAVMRASGRLDPKSFLGRGLVCVCGLVGVPQVGVVARRLRVRGLGVLWFVRTSTGE